MTATVQQERTDFIPPPEAPVFEPTWDEFKDPASYIKKIRHVGEKTGIIKIRPPPSWQPPFAVDVENFKFIPRLQKLNELEARSRLKLNFVDRLLKYWHLQGISMKIPVLEKRLLDLHKLHKVVEHEGGYEQVCRERKWLKVAELMGYSLRCKGMGSTLRQHYERILYPYDLFTAGASVLPEKIKNEVDRSGYIEKCEMKSVCMSRMMTKPSGFMKRVAPKVEVVEQKPSVGEKTADQYFCEVCAGGEDDEFMLLCDGCDDAYHTFCLTPPLPCIPPGDWRCPRCIDKECSRPSEGYGFEESQNEYTLYSFGVKADQFKSDYFKKSGQMVSTTEVEREFWRLVSSLEEDVVVEYGADIHALEKGSGFPTEKTKHRFPGYEEYISSGWNLNNLPVLNSSVLRYVDVNISGMKVPWCYVGMCFSCFCWHTEDHWSYSINYMHWGEPKTWYGVPGSAAELLEECMRKNAGELFENSPDLLHQLTTIINPNILMDYGVPIYRTDQCAGEFVITFPRSYHAGFNQGYNFAEAVNYCPPDWLPWGRSCIDNYRSVNRQCVFSHDEMLCMMSCNPSKLSIELAGLLADDLKHAFDKEKKLRDTICGQGVKVLKEVDFEKIDDDERQCMYCHTTIFLSAFTCECDNKKMWCIDHTEWPQCECKPSDWQLLYRYTADEMDSMVEAVVNRAKCLEKWIERANAVLDNTSGQLAEFTQMKAVASEATNENIPVPADLLRKLNNIVREADECIVLAARLTRRRGLRGCGESARNLSLDEVRNFCARVDSVPCLINEVNVLKVQELLKNVELYQREVRDTLKSSEMPPVAKLRQLADSSQELDIEIVESKTVKWMLDQAVWLDEVGRITADMKKVTLNALGRLTDDGSKLEKVASLDATCTFHPSCVKTLADLRKQHTTAKSIEKQIQMLLGSGSSPELSAVQSTLSECEKVTIHLPCIENLKSVHSKAVSWITSVQTILQRREHDIHVTEVEHLMKERAEIPLNLDLSKPLETKLANIKLWKEQMAKTFNMRSANSPLLKIIFPLVDVTTCLGDNGTATEDSSFCDSGAALLETLNVLKTKSIDEVEKLRATNSQKIAGNLKSTVAESDQNQCLLCFVEIQDTDKPRESSMRHPSTICAEYFCSSCRQLQTSRPCFADVARLVNAWKQLQVCLPDGRSLAWLMECISEWRVELNRADFKNYCNSDPQLPSDSSAVDRMTDEIFERLQKLLVQGIVLGVDLDEIPGICHIIYNYRKQKLENERKKLLMMQSEAALKKKRKSSDSGDDNPVAQKKDSKKPKQQKETTGGSKEAERKKKRTPKSGGSRKRRKNSKSSSDSGDDSYDTCSAETCSQPVGSKINWVQCDGCELWYHLVCVGLTPSQVADDSYEYHCNNCQKSSENSKSTILETPTTPENLPAKELTPQPASLVVMPQITLASTSSLNTASIVKSSVVVETPVHTLPVHVAAAAQVNLVGTQQRPIAGAALPHHIGGILAGFAQPAIGLLAPVSHQFGSVNTFRPLDYKGPSATAAPLIGLNRNLERTVATTLASLPGRALSTGTSLSFGQYLYTPWMTNNGGSVAPR